MDQASLRRPPYFIYLLIVGVFVFFYHLGERDLSTRLESEAAVVGRDMLDTGRFIVPHLFDEPFVDNRPPGAFWLVAASYRLTGLDNEWAAYLPSALAALVCVLMAFAAGKRAAGPSAGFLSGLMLLSMATFLLIGRMSQQDMLLALFTLLALWAFWRSLDERGSALRYVLAFHVFLGMGALVKGPAIVLNVLFPIAVYVVLSRRWRDVKWISCLAASPVSLVLILWWYAYVWIYWPSMREALEDRFTNQAAIHLEAWYFYIARLPELMGPAVLFLPLLVAGWLKAGHEERRGALGFFLVTSLTMLVVYSFFPSKRTHYLVPILPPLAIAMGIVMANQRYPEGRYMARTGLVFATLFPVILVAWIVVAPMKLEIESTMADWIAFAVLSGLGVFSWKAYRKGQLGLAFNLSWAALVLALGFTLGDPYRRVNNQRSAKVFAEMVAQAVPGNARLGSIDGHAALPFYTGWTRMKSVDITEAADFLEGEDDYLIVIKQEELDRIDGSAYRIVLSHHPYRHDDTAYLLQGDG